MVWLDFNKSLVIPQSKYNNFLSDKVPAEIKIILLRYFYQF